MNELLIVALALWFLGLVVVLVVLHRGLQALCKQSIHDQREPAGDGGKRPGPHPPDPTNHSSE